LEARLSADKKENHHCPDRLELELVNSVAAEKSIDREEKAPHVAVLLLCYVIMGKNMH